MIKKILIYENEMFASPGHLMNHFRKYNINNSIDIKYLTQCMFKNINNVKGVNIEYSELDLNQIEDRETFNRIKSLTRSGLGYIMNMQTPYDYFVAEIATLLNKESDPIKEAIGKAVAHGVGTEKDFYDMIKKYKGGS